MSSQKYAGMWRLQRLAPLAGRLPAPWVARYETLVREFGEPSDEWERPEPRTWIGPTSPLTQEELASFSPEELVEWLRGWRPESGWAQPTEEGASRLVAVIVGESPSQYAEKALLFQALDATYVRGLLSGLRTAAKAERPFAWDPVLELGAWLLDQKEPASSPPVGTEGDRDPHWGWARRELANLISTGLEAKLAQPHRDLRSRVWRILSALSEDPEPTPEYEQKYGGDNMDPAMLSINTTRGEAMHAVMRYALWLMPSPSEETGGESWPGFDALPEVRDVLEQHLDPGADPSLAIRAVYGQWLPWLVLLDRGWTENSLESIFPSRSELSSYRDTAWDTYILFNQPYRNVFDVVGAQYSRAVVDIGHARATRTVRHESPDEYLAEHIVLAYLLGWIELGPTELLAQLFAVATEEIRVHALEFVGRVLNQSAPLAPGLVDRAQRLWDWQTDRRGSTEFAAFGWWYQADALDELWGLTRLVAALEHSDGKIDMDHGVAERLASSPVNMGQRLRAFELMVRGAPGHSWEIGSWSSALRTVLESALTQGEFRQSAQDLIGRLLAKGYGGFSDPLSSPDDRS